ncbi:MAG: hypothetical protein OXN81_15475 [Alphaproteobacteria bacterium]|nr:hypothetical protein [Alphaproteobacteria bacterium]
MKRLMANIAAFGMVGCMILVMSGCGGGSSTKDELEQTKEQLAAAEEARKKAEAEAEVARAAAAAAAEEQRKAEDAAAAAAEEQRKAEQDRDQARQETEETQRQLTEAEQAELRARASSFATHLDLGTGGADEMVTPTVSWPRGSNLTFRPPGTLTPGSAAPSVPGGWRSAGFTGQTGTANALVDDTVYLYTNIQAPGTRAFWKVYGLAKHMTASLESLARGSSATPTRRDPNDNANYTELTVSGSLNGASGKFTCSSCTGAVADGYDSHVTFSQGAPDFGTEGSWVFTPSSIANGYRVDQDDAYLYFGIWSSIPKSISQTTGYNFRYMEGGGAESGSDLRRFDALTGPATFRGGAVGRYVTQGQVGGQNAKIGTFTATATLNADFGAADAGTLSGSITDFREDGNPLAGWQVTLGSTTDIGVASTIASAAASGATVANVGGVSVGGSWGATFYGIDNDGVAELTDTVKYPATQYPPVDLAGVAGWFDATGTSVSLAGAFAATPRN